jgi:ATP synthase protein I
MSAPEHPEDPFVKAVRQQAERVRAGRRTFWQGLAMVGVVGWLVSLPTVGGALLGRWIDRRADTGIRWTLGFLVLGLAAGCATAWRHVKEGLEE